jgi:broad specificity phosphatase PhoE
MERLILILVACCLLTSCATTYYVVRHAEKEQPPAGTSANMMSANNPPLSKAGTERAEALKQLLQGKHIRYIYSTNTIRTVSTAAPLASEAGVTTSFYSQVDREFITTLKSLKKNTLVVGHSNTVDDIIQQLTGTNHIPADLPDAAYDNLYIIKKKGKKMSFQATTYGAAAH